MRNSIVASTIACTALSSALFASPANAAQSTDALVCAGHSLTIRAGDSNSNDNGGWAVAQVVEGGSGHLIPVAFAGTLIDTTTGDERGQFASAKGKGHAAASASTVDCTLAFIGTVADFSRTAIETLPAGVSLSDVAEFTLVATVVVKP